MVCWHHCAEYVSASHELCRTSGHQYMWRALSDVTNYMEHASSGSPIYVGYCRSCYAVVTAMMKRGAWFGGW
jgi:hypothetical protein